LFLQIYELFATSKQTASCYISIILKDNELDKNSVVKEFLTTASNGKQYNILYKSNKNSQKVAQNLCFVNY